MTSRTAHLARGLAGVALVAAAAGCVAQPRDPEAYRGDARVSAESAVSEARTAQLALEHWLAGDLADPYAGVVVSEAETAIGPVADAFGGVDPPAPASDPLRTQVLDLLGEAEDAAAAGRTALRRGDRDGVGQAAADLGRVSDALESLSERLR